MTESIAIMIVLDTSGSMLQEGTFEWQAGSPKVSRHEASKRAFRLFVAGGEGPDGTRFDGRSTERGTDAIGLVTFEMWPQTLSPPTLNHTVLLHLLDHAAPGTDEGSNIGDAIAEGLIRLEKTSPPRKVMILLSDGELEYTGFVDEDRKPLKPRQAAQLAAKLGIPIYVIDTGGDLPPDAKSADIERRQDARAINQAVADLSGGRLFSANDGKKLLEVCRTIDKLERQPIPTHAFRRYHELYPWFVGAALGLLLVLVLLEQTIWRRFP
ncbi:MAG: VWA domain-containing protein [Planctomycetes bacterium]|nr:VWA domain-containing protein [Planctomycetota bacterium]